MKNLFNSILTAFAMFSKIPVRTKSLNWEPDGMRYMLAAFPLIGVVIGAVMFGWILLCDYFEAAAALRALGVTLIPVLITGGLHLDGLCDTCDALGANTTPERRREILKDPRAGAFGVIGVVTHLIAYFALALAFDYNGAGVLRLCLGFAVSRAMSGMAVSGFPNVGDGTAKTFKDASAQKVTFFLCCVNCFFMGLSFGIVSDFAGTVAWLAVSLACFAHLRYTATRKFGGMSGDLAGWFLQRCELWQLASIVLVGWVQHWK
ncbi:MAG: adenosylcobinamide-GDP ribazoletransferase [Oscillospiraceae bacterium]|jgi:adenosylcobinamide-GDP ribazoletransferase|nr:adenosylcobinamide-GDP ribazoletransferase [Oscillospiraceae bacterium]